MDLIFNMDISYSQLVVFQKGIENPFNDWQDIHIDQGFAWRPGAVSFGSLLADEMCQINVGIKPQVKILENSIRTIVVPFEILEDGIGIASVTQENDVKIPSGLYELVFNVIPKPTIDRLDVYDFSFVKTKNPIAKILVADKMLNPSNKLLMEAKPAVFE